MQPKSTSQIGKIWHQELTKAAAPLVDPQGQIRFGGHCQIVVAALSR